MGDDGDTCVRDARALSGAKGGCKGATHTRWQLATSLPDWRPNGQELAVIAHNDHTCCNSFWLDEELCWTVSFKGGVDADNLLPRCCLSSPRYNSSNKHTVEQKKRLPPHQLSLPLGSSLPGQASAH